ncbi:unnamed protein product, partial [Mesorhabditis spiculigera]
MLAFPIITATTVTGALLKQVVEVLIENDVYLGILHVKVKSDVAWMPLEIDALYSKETIEEFLDGLKKEDLARIQNKIHLVCLSSEDEMGRQLWIVDKGRLRAWNDDYKPVEQAAEPIRNCLERQQAAMDDIIKYYEENKGNLADMRTMAGQIRFGRNANQSSCNLIIHSKDLSDRAITKQLAEVFLVLAKGKAQSICVF